ncbi:hypothetical protein [Streptacidiphilus sp. PAMC 29251]
MKIRTAKRTLTVLAAAPAMAAVTSTAFADHTHPGHGAPDIAAAWDPAAVRLRLPAAPLQPARHRRQRTDRGPLRVRHVRGVLA